MRTSLIAAAALLLAGCQSSREEVRPVVAVLDEEEPEWRRVATPADQARLESLDRVWAEALAEARQAGFRRAIAAEGDLLDPGAALPRAAPSPGSYRCRLVRLGASRPRERPFVRYKPFYCHVGVEGEQLSITKQTGSQRPGGYLWETADTRRLVFLGSIALGNERSLRAYGDDPLRDVAGLFERTGDFRYRLVIPTSIDGAKLHIYELIPTGLED